MEGQPDRMSDNNSQPEEIDVLNFHSIERVSQIKKDIEGVSFEASKFQAVDWRAALTYRTKKGYDQTRPLCHQHWYLKVYPITVVDGVRASVYGVLWVQTNFSESGHIMDCRSTVAVGGDIVLQFSEFSILRKKRGRQHFGTQSV
jgi:hypothetical protein